MSKFTQKEITAQKNKIQTIKSLSAPFEIQWWGASLIFILNNYFIFL